MENKESVGIRMSNVDARSGDPDAKTNTKPEMKQKCNDPLINVIQKLTAMVKGEQATRTLEGKKRSYPVEEAEVQPVSKMADLAEVSTKRIKEETTASTIESPSASGRKVMFYQCSLCKFISSSFETLAAHVKNHGQQNEIILMCSECHLTFKSHGELEAHIKTHCENEVTAPSQVKDQPQEDKPLSPNAPEPARKKWYAYEAYGLYRCLICRYTCGQQRMLKTHAWKHAGEVDCSYPIFEEENESASLPDSTVAHTPQGSESVLSENTEVKQHVQNSGAQECSAMPKDVVIKETETQVQSAAPGPLTEVDDDAASDTDQDNLIRESLLSSAQKIISCSQNTKGHVNVIVERLPGAEETGSQKPFVLNADAEVKKKLESHLGGSVELYHADKNVVESEEIIIGWSNPAKNSSDFVVSDENSPPVRRRTNSECLRLHSLAAEALVTMPIQVVECPKYSLRLINDPGSVDPDTGQGDGDKNYGTCPNVESSKVPEELKALNQKDTREKSELTQTPMKTGISTSLLKVIEKLRERTDQNATDDDILKELQDNAQNENTSDLGSNNGLVEYLPCAERPYRCRLCHYTSDNKGYIKQHLRVHRQRQPYQCPICEHIAENSGDLENHMINHCKAIKYECKNCNESFYYKSQLRTHEREHRKLLDSGSSATDDPQLCTEEADEQYSPEGGNKSSMSKVYRCDVCSYTSPTYVGVRNHIRIHTSDKPYRCSLCGYVCSHPPSLKSHMWKHASDQNYNYEQVNKAINEAMSQSTRPQRDPLKKLTPEDSSTAVDSDTLTSASRPAPEVTGYIENQNVSQSQSSLCSNEKLQSQVRPGTELCVLLFCCCICGFESTSKELLMEHMKAHEGEIINIILNKSESTS
ncbi:PREDICTED: zinc finger protein 507 [Nanorana parkeri]|uniref:zinc finger protein 507 n=1 Tax=Nanorana parkeri TaxID=125878 RepID=UPI000854B04F|nr:PREDICTED: zinc finger protein 507 [Nanorana parkeri]